MQIINATISSPLIPLGYQGENHSRQIVFDIADWQKQYGSGSVLLAHQRGGDTQPYPVAVTVEGGKAIWTVQSADVAVAGNAGHCQLSYLVDDKVVKSFRWRTEVYPSLDNTGDTPEPYVAWMDAMQNYVEAHAVQGEKGEPFRYSDFSASQLADLRDNIHRGTFAQILQKTVSGTRAVCYDADNAPLLAMTICGAGNPTDGFAGGTLIFNGAEVDLSAYTLRAIGTAKDTIHHDGTQWVYAQRIGMVDMGTLSWSIPNSSFGVEYGGFYARVSGIKGGAGYIATTAYPYGVSDFSWSRFAGYTDKTISRSFPVSDKNVFVKDLSYTDRLQFAEALSGVMLYYELETPVVTPLPSDLQTALNALSTVRGENIATLDGVATVEMTYARNLNDTLDEINATTNWLGLLDAQKLTAPAVARVGQFLRIAGIDEDGSLVLEAVDLNG